MDEQDYYEQQVNFTPNPEEPFPPSPIPGPSPGPRPLPGQLPFPPEQLPRPLLPPDWWRCRRLGPVSGRYEGAMTAPTVGSQVLDLRVDIDPRYANSPVMNRISGDFYRVLNFGFPGRPPFIKRIYLESWIIDAPTVNWSECRVEITGTVRFWKGLHPATSIQVRIPWGTFTTAGPATVTFTEAGGSTSSYSCSRKSHCFRDLALEVDVCQSVNEAPLLPSYDTHSHPTRPAGLPRRTLTTEEAYREAGICVSIRPNPTFIDDSAAQFATWSAAELHDAMEVSFSQFSGTWPNWQMWGLLAGTFDDPLTGGIMFDAGAAFGGAGEPPERQGFAVFRDHSWFDDLVPNPANDAQAEAMRKLLYTYVHEAGHAFNFLHSWDKNRPDSLSWMNYDWRYDNRNGANSFWSNFGLRFDDEELIHLRHGDRTSVVMGGDPWASGGHLESPPGAMSQLEGTGPVEFLLRSRGYFEFMEPVAIEFRIRNLFEDFPFDLDTRLDPEYGGVAVYIRRPDSQIVQYDPVLCKLATPDIRTLQPPNQAAEGEDRYSEEVFLSYGQYGFYFDEPGEYLVRAVYQGAGDLLIPSNVHRVRVGYPRSTDEERLAQDFFTYGVGMNLYLGGSRSPFLSQGMDVLEEMADRYKDTLRGAKAATTVAASVARPFFHLQEGVMTKIHDAEPEKALALTEPAVELYRREEAKTLNLSYHQLVNSRVKSLEALGDDDKAKEELAALHDDLEGRGVNEVVLADIRASQESL